jgi:hypothetical protein
VPDYARQLEQDLSWREAELASLKLLVSESTVGSVRQTSLLRALWVMLYAHYEGFFKFAWDLYLGELERLSVARELTIDPLARFSLTRNFQLLRGDLSLRSLWGCFTRDFQSWMREPLRFEERLETRSNLWPGLAKENSEAIGLQTTKLDTYEIELRALVSRRNDIAHGKNMVVQNLAEYQKYEDAATLAMHELAVAVLDTLEQREYLRPQTA